MLAPQSAAAGHTKVSVVLIAPDNKRRRAIASVISATQARIVREFGEFPNENGLSELAGGDCDVIVVDLDGGVGPGVDLISAICSRNVMVSVMACSSGHEADVVIRSMRA